MKHSTFKQVGSKKQGSVYVYCTEEGKNKEGRRVDKNRNNKNKRSKRVNHMATYKVGPN